MEKLKVKLEQIACSNCKTKVTVAEVVRDGKKLKYAPCGKCGCENIISSEEHIRGPAEVDVLNEKEVVQYIRDLYNLSNLLEKKLDEELLAFIQILKRAGYSGDRIHQFITWAGYGTRYENEVTVFGDKIVPSPIRSRGSQKEWEKIKAKSR